MASLWHTFYELVKGLLVLFVVVSFVMNVIRPYLPFDKIKQVMSSGRGMVGSFAGVVLGFVTPFCSCSTIPLMVTLLNRGVPFQAVMTFFFTSPLLNIWVLGLMALVYGWKVTAIYAVVTVVFSIVIGYVLDRLNFQEQIKAVIVEGQEEEDMKRRRCDWAHHLKLSIGETWKLIRSVGLYIVIGAFIGAFIKEAVPTSVFSFFQNQSEWWVIPVAAVLGMPLYVRLSTILPVTQALLAGGFPLAPVMSLIIGGAGASLPEVLMLTSIFKKRLMVAYMIAIFTMATFAGYLFLGLNL
ncbi:permease [Shouchella lonarensis]|nr:permease [Shouchella lonarensis]